MSTETETPTWRSPAPVVPDRADVRERVRKAAEAVIAQWVEIGYRTARAGTGMKDPAERAKQDAFHEMRYLHLAEPWLPAATIADAVLAVVGQGVSAEQAWDEGWEALRVERVKQECDAEYPITRRNPYRPAPSTTTEGADR